VVRPDTLSAADQQQVDTLSSALAEQVEIQA
jgi:hypothetical protein